MKCPYCQKILNEKEEKIGYCCDINEIKNNMKTQCVICGNDLKMDVKRMSEDGNWCKFCKVKAEHDARYSRPKLDSTNNYESYRYHIQKLKKRKHESHSEKTQ